MHNEHTQINCPNCNHTVDVNDILYRQLQGELQNQFEQQLQSEKAKLLEEKSVMDAKLQQLATKEKNIELQITTAIEDRLHSERTSIAKAEREKAQAICSGVTSTDYGRV